MPKRPCITDEQLEVLEYLLRDHDIIAQNILEQWNLDSLSAMPKNKFIAALDKILALKDLYKNTDSRYLKGIKPKDGRTI